MCSKANAALRAAMRPKTCRWWQAAKESLDHPLFHDVSEVYKRSVLPVQRRILGDLFGAFLESGLPPEQRTPCPPHAIARMQTYLAPPPEWQQMIAMA
jgi:hypothetical protein